MAADIAIVEGTAQSGWNTDNVSSYNGPGASGVGWGSATPTGDLALVFVVNSKASAPDTPTTLTGNSLTWTRIGPVLSCADSSAPARKATCWVAPISGASAGSLTVGGFGSNQTSCGIFVFYLTGCKITSGGVDALVQAITFTDDLGARHSWGRFTNKLSDYDNAVLSCFIIDGGETSAKVIPMTGWNKGTQQDITAPAYAAACVWNNKPDSVWPAIDWNVSGAGQGALHHSGGLAVEIANNAPAASNTNVSHGPLVGLVTATSVRFTGRLGDTTSPWAGRAGNATFKYGTDPALAGSTNVAVKGGPSTDYCVTATASGLTPGLRYYYQLVGDAGSSTINTFVLPAVSPSQFKIAYFTDFQNLSAPPSTPLDDTFSLSDAKGMDAYAIGGDFDHTNPGLVGADEAASRANSRAMFKRLLGWDGTNTSGMQAFVVNVLRKYPMLSHSWDDHDYKSNNSDGTWPFKDSVAREEVNNFLPLRPLPTAPGGIWQTQRFGTLFSFFNIDGRSQRNAPSDADPGTFRGDGTATKSMLDGLPGLGASGQFAAFKAWLLSEEAAGCIWKIVKMQTPWNRTMHKGQAGDNPPYDNWFGYQTEQQAIRDYITANSIKRVVLLTGDVHQWAFENGNSDPVNLIEIIGACPNFVNAGGETYANADKQGTWSHGFFPASAITPPAGNGYTLITLTPAALVAQAWLHDGTQPLADMTIPGIASGVIPSGISGMKGKGKKGRNQPGLPQNKWPW